jgi:hypothetical protein
LERRQTATSLNAATRDLVEGLFRMAPSPAQVRKIGTYAAAFIAQHKQQLDQLVERLAADIDLDASTRDIDRLLIEAEGWPTRSLREVLVNFLGFPFWDVLSFPMLPWREAGEFNEIKVDRISANDARGINRLGTFPVKGTAFNQFAAFLSRSYRENDYLLGRLHAVDRLIDIVCDAAGSEAITRDAMAALKRKAFIRVLDAEEAHLPTCKKMIAELRSALGDAAGQD